MSIVERTTGQSTSGPMFKGRSSTDVVTYAGAVSDMAEAQLLLEQEFNVGVLDMRADELAKAVKSPGKYLKGKAERIKKTIEENAKYFDKLKERLEKNTGINANLANELAYNHVRKMAIEEMAINDSILKRDTMADIAANVLSNNGAVSGVNDLIN